MSKRYYEISEVINLVIELINILILLFLQQPEPLAVIKKCKLFKSEAIYMALLHAKNQLECHKLRVHHKINEKPLILPLQSSTDP